MNCRLLYELPSALADGQCLKQKKALAESVKIDLFLTALACILKVNSLTIILDA
jgi:hypothetical protein